MRSNYILILRENISDDRFTFHLIKYNNYICNFIKLLIYYMNGTIKLYKGFSKKKILFINLSKLFI